MDYLKKLNKKENSVVAGIFILALLLRSLILFFNNPPIKGDETSYLLLAQSLIQGEGFSLNGQLTSFAPPLYPFFLSAFLWLHKILYIREIHVILGSLFCIPLYLLGKRLFNKTVALLSIFLFSIHISLIYSSHRLLSETLFSLLLLCFVVFFLKEDNFKSCVLAGVSLGLATLTRPHALYLILMIAFYAFLLKRYKKLWIIVIMIMVILPWSIRNTIVHHHFVLTTTSQGSMLYNSSHPVKGKIFGFATPDDAITRKAETISSEIERNSFLLKEGITTILNNPFQYFKWGIIKILFFWVPFDWEIISNDGTATFNFSYSFILFFFILGIVFAWKKKAFNHQHYFILGMIVFFLLFCIITFGSPRFRLPLEPYIILFGSYGLLTFYNTINRKKALSIIISFFLLNVYIYQHTDFYKKKLSRSLQSIGLW